MTDSQGLQTFLRACALLLWGLAVLSCRNAGCCQFCKHQACLITA